MTHTLSFKRAIWHGDEYLGTYEPCDTSKLTHNMDVDYWLTRQVSNWVVDCSFKRGANPNLREWLARMVARSDIRECPAEESLEHSRDLRDVWFFNCPSWLPSGWRNECMLGAGA